MKIVRLYSGSDQKSHFEEIELKFGGNQPMLSTDMRAATGAVFRSAPAGLFLGTPSGAAAPIPRHPVRFLGNRSQQRRQARIQNRRRHARRRHHRRRPHLARARQRAPCVHDRAVGGLKEEGSSRSKRSNRSIRLEAQKKSSRRNHATYRRAGLSFEFLFPDHRCRRDGIFQGRRVRRFRRFAVPDSQNFRSPARRRSSTSSSARRTRRYWRFRSGRAPSCSPPAASIPTGFWSSAAI